MTISKNILNKAAEQGLIEHQQIEALYKFINSQLEDNLSRDNEEPLRFIRNFGDVFITLGIVLLVIAINMTALNGFYYLVPAAGFIVIAEWLIAVRRLVLPGMAILLALLYFIHNAIAFYNEVSTSIELALLCLCSLFFYLRYKLPFTLVPLTTSLIALIIIQINVDITQYPLIFVGFGLIVFIIAMRFDSSDTKRTGYLSDNAFWLHLLASPLFVHGMMFSFFTREQAWLQAINTGAFIGVFFTGFFLLALLIDRRVMLISTQFYIIYALNQLFHHQIGAGENIMIYTLMSLSLFIIFFGSYWYLTRRLIFGFLSNYSISRYLPDLIKQDINVKN